MHLYQSGESLQRLGHVPQPTVIYTFSSKSFPLSYLKYCFLPSIMQAVNASQGDCLSLKLMYFYWLGVEAAEGMSGLMGGEHLYSHFTSLQLSNPLFYRERRETSIYKETRYEIHKTYWQVCL